MKEFLLTILINVAIFLVWALFQWIWRLIFCRPKRTADGGYLMNLPYLAEFTLIIKLILIIAFYTFCIYYIPWYLGFCIFIVILININEIYCIYKNRNDYLILHPDYFEISDNGKISRINSFHKLAMVKDSADDMDYAKAMFRKHWCFHVYKFEDKNTFVIYDLMKMNLMGYSPKIKKIATEVYKERFSFDAYVISD